MTPRSSRTQDWTSIARRTFVRGVAGMGLSLWMESLSGTVRTTPVVLDEESAELRTHTDEHAHALELVTQTDGQLESDQTGQVIECADVDDSCETWRFVDLFVGDEETGYTLGRNWNNTAKFDATATRKPPPALIGQTRNDTAEFGVATTTAESVALGANYPNQTERQCKTTSRTMDERTDEHT